MDEGDATDRAAEQPATARHELETAPIARPDAETAPLPRPDAETASLAPGPRARASAAPALEPRLGAKIDGRYELLAELGRGGFGVVYRARDLELRREVALKLLRGQEGTRQARFLREGELTAALDHPGIVRVHARGEAAEGPYLVYELVEGARTLRDVLPELAPSEAAARARDVARALGHAHARGVVHRDVKPANVLIDREGRVRVADFGLALAAGSERLTRSGEAVGTPHYLAPEAFVPGLGPVGPPADVWAVGVILYEAFTGRHPFAAGGLDLASLLRRIALARPAAPRRLASVPRALEAVCLRCLERDPMARYPDGETLAAALDQALAGRLSAWPRGRHLAAAASLGALTLGVALAWTGLRSRGGPPDAPSEVGSDAAGVAPARERAAALGGGLAALEQAFAALTPAEAMARLEAEPALEGAAPRDALLVACERLLLEDPAGARAALAHAPPGPERARLRVLAAFVAGDSLEMLRLTAPAVAERPGGSEGASIPARTRVYLKLLTRHDPVDPQQQRALMGTLDPTAQEVAAAATTLRADCEVLIGAPDELVASGRRLLELARPLGRGDLEQRLVLRDALNAIVEMALAVGRLRGAYLGLPKLERLLLEAAELDPAPGPQDRLALAQAWIELTRAATGTEVRIHEQVRRDPHRWAGSLSPAGQWVAHALWFLTRATFEHVPSGELAATLQGPASQLTMRLQVDLRVDLARVLRDRAVGLRAGGRERETAELFARARRHLEDAVAFAKLTADTAGVVRVQQVVTALAASDVSAARALLAAGPFDRALLALLEGEAALIAGDLAGARSHLEEAVRQRRYAAAFGALAHLELLEGRPEVAQALLRQGAASPRALEALGLDWHEPPLAANTLRGGWWPGAR